MEEALEVTGLWSIKEYIQRQKDNIAANISNRAIYEPWKGVENISGSCRFMRWWDQDVGREVE